MGFGIAAVRIRSDAMTTANNPDVTQLALG
jgi:hypothetical protein